MSLAAIKTGFRSWLESRVRIDAWDLDVPLNRPTVLGGDRYPANVAIEMPAGNLTLAKRADYVEGSATLVYAILYRFHYKASKEQLPVKAVEALVNYLGEWAVLYWEGISDRLISLELARTNDPVTLARIEGEDGDWLIVARLEFDVVFMSTAIHDVQFTPAVPPSGEDPGSPAVPGAIDPLQPTPDGLPTPLNMSRADVGLNRATYPVNPDNPDTYTFDRLIRIPEEV